MVPAKFPFDYQGQRPKVTALECKEAMTMSFFCLYSVKRSPKQCYIESRYLTAILMQLSNDLQISTGKVKVI